MEQAVSVALFFELLWMDLIPAGTYIPPQMVGATCAALCLTSGLGLEATSQAALALFLVLPLAYMGRWVETSERRRLDTTHERLLLAADGPDFKPGEVILHSMTRLAVLNALLFIISTAVLAELYGPIWDLMREIHLFKGLTWWQLWFGASMGGLLSLRYRAAHSVVLAGTVAVALGGLAAALLR